MQVKQKVNLYSVLSKLMRNYCFANVRNFSTRKIFDMVYV